MKNILLTLVLSTISFISVFSQTVEKTFNPNTFVRPDSVTIANGTKISWAEHVKRCDAAWNNSFGKMSPEDKKVLEGVKIEVAVPEKQELIEPEKPKSPISK